MENPSLSKQHFARWRHCRVPVAPYFELTPRCTLDCRMCYVHLTPAQMGDRRELTTEEWLRISDEAAAAGMLFVVLTGGECMLHPGFWEIYEHLLDLGVAVAVNTNAVALTDADLARFARRRPASVRVSLYAATEEGYERATGRRALAPVVENLRKLRDQGLLNSVAITLTRFNADELPAMIRLARELRLQPKYVLDLSEPYADTGRYMEDFTLSNEALHRIHMEVLRPADRPLSRNEPVTELPALLPDDPDYRGLPCGAGKSSFAIHWDGRMSPCFDCRGTVRVPEVGFQAAWEETKRLAEAFPLPVECRDCRFAPICSVCVMSRADPRNPGHCNPRRCQYTIERYNLGLASLAEPVPMEEKDC